MLCDADEQRDTFNGLNSNEEIVLLNCSIQTNLTMKRTLKLTKALHLTLRTLKLNTYYVVEHNLFVRFTPF